MSKRDAPVSEKVIDTHNQLLASGENQDNQEIGEQQAKLTVDQLGNDADMDDQTRMLLKEPFVQRIQDFFKMVQDRFRAEPDRFLTFKDLCRAINKQVISGRLQSLKAPNGTNCRDDNYEQPLVSLFKLLEGEESICKILVDLLPELFVQKIFPEIQKDLVTKFDAKVKEMTNATIYDTYHQICISHYKNEIGIEEFREQLFELFSQHEHIMKTLPSFFEERSESHEKPAQDKQAGQAPQQGKKPSKAQPNKQQATAQQSQAQTETIQANQSVQSSQAQATTNQATDLVDQQEKLAQGAGKKKLEQKQVMPVIQQPVQQRPIPEILQKSSKTDVSFFLDKIPDSMKSKDSEVFMKLFSLYLAGVLTQHEFYDLTADLMDEDTEPQLDQLRNLVSQRDTARREGNPLLKPVSEIDQSEQVSKSYFRLPENFTVPVCSGRYLSDQAKQTLNDRFCSIPSGQGDFRFKVKNQAEDILFKNEDEMYQTDHRILQLENMISKLSKELDSARAWTERRASQEGTEFYKPINLRDQHYSFIIKWYGDNINAHDHSWGSKIRDILAGRPVKLIEIILKRFTDFVQQMKREKAEKIAGWRVVGETNFYKSLDHRAFLFKKAQKDCLGQKSMFDELKAIYKQPHQKKTESQLKGGSDGNEFFSTYTSFNLKNIQAYEDEALQAPELVEDHPINLRDPALLNSNPGALPQMRFLFNDRSILALAFKILIRVPRENNATAADKGKIDEQLEILVNKFFKIEQSFKQLKEASRKIAALSAEDISLLTAPSGLYYTRRHKNGFTFESLSNDEEPKTQDQGATLNIPKASDTESDSASQQSCKPNLSQSDLLQTIGLQENSQNAQSSQDLLIPAFKDGYSVIFGTQSIYLVFKLVATIYERLVKAKQLVNSKVEEDLAKQETIEALGLAGSDKEASVKLQEFKQKAISERFSMLISSLIGTISVTQKLDSSNYEDIARRLMGSHAYLLFLFDKLVATTLKLIPVWKNAEESQKSLRLFKQFTNHKVLNEYLYLTQFQTQMQSLNNFSGMCIRILYSKQSGIMCVHLFNLNPYPGIVISQPQGGNLSQAFSTFNELESCKQDLLNETIYSQNPKLQRHERQPSPPPDAEMVQEQDLQEKSAQKQIEDDMEDIARYLRRPVFLYRNRRKMKMLRKHLTIPQSNNKPDGQLVVDNGLVIRQVPSIRKLQFDANTQDLLLYKRRKTQDQSVIEEQNYKAQLRLQQVLEDARKKNERLQSDSDPSSNDHCGSNSMGYERQDDDEEPPRALSSPRDAVIEDDQGQSQLEAVKESNQDDTPMESVVKDEEKKA